MIFVGSKNLLGLTVSSCHHDWSIERAVFYYGSVNVKVWIELKSYSSIWTIHEDPRFSTLGFMARALRAWAINPRGELGP